MARTNLLKLTCDFCGLTETFDQGEPKSMAKNKIRKWIQVSRADDPIVNPMGQQIDPSRWFDSNECVKSGLEREDRQYAEEQANEAVAAKANRPKLVGPVPAEMALPPLKEVVNQES